MVVCNCYFYQYFVPTGHRAATQGDSLKAKWYMIIQCFRQIKTFNLQPNVIKIRKMCRLYVSLHGGTGILPVFSTGKMPVSL